jgi:hypothetical protein
MANSALIIPAPVIAGITGVKVVEMTLITRATMPVGLAFLSPPVGLFLRQGLIEQAINLLHLIADNNLELAALLHHADHAGEVPICASLTFARSLNSMRSRVAQWVSMRIFSAPPTAWRILSAVSL